MSDAEIHAFVDGALETDREAAIMAAVGADPELSARVLAYQYQNTGLHALYDHYLEEPVPERIQQLLRAHQSRAAPRSGNWRPGLLKAAVLAGVFVMGAAAGVGGYRVFLPRPLLFDSVIKQAVLGHQILEAEEPKPQKLINEAGEIIDRAQVTAGFSVPLRVPSITNVDQFRPVSYRNIAGSAGPTAQIMYRDTQERDISLYIQPHSASKGIPFQNDTFEGYEVVYWIDGPLVYVLVGKEIGEDALARMARTVYGARGLAQDDQFAPEIKSSTPPAALPAKQVQ